MTPGFDAHTHLDLPAFDADRDAVLARARAAGIGGAVIASADPVDWDRVQAVGEAHALPWVLGLHPWWGASMDDAAYSTWHEALAARATPWGIGETGLDHLRATTPDARARQVESLRFHLALARDRDVPVVLHVVRAYPEALRVIEADGLPRAGGMVHAWSGSADLVKRAVRLGLMLSFGGPLVRSERMQAALRATPDAHLLLESDAPDQPLTPGARGEPADVKRIAEVAAELRGVDADDLLAACGARARALFRGS